MTAQAIIFTLAAIGLSETVYLIRKHFADEKPTCIVGHPETCLRVLESEYNNIFGFPNEILGFLFYFVTMVITSLLVVNVGPAPLLDLIAKIIIIAGTVMSVIFTYLQWRVIEAWCTWCLMSAFTIFFMLIVLLANNLTLIP